MHNRLIGSRMKIRSRTGPPRFAFCGTKHKCADCLLNCRASARARMPMER